GFDQEPTTVRHSIARVDHQVQDNLFDLAGVGLYRANVSSDDCLHLHSLGQKPAQELVEIQYDAVEVNDFRLQDLLAAEGQQLVNERRSAFGSITDVLQVAPKPSVLYATIHSHFHVSFDDRKQIIEIVRDAAGQSPNGFHPSRLLQLVLQRFPLRDVYDDAFHARMVVAAGNNDRRVAHPDDLTVFAR